MNVDIVCGSCGKTIKKMIKLRPLKDVIQDFSGKCTFCGKALTVSDFTLDIEEIPE